MSLERPIRFSYVPVQSVVLVEQGGGLQDLEKQRRRKQVEKIADKRFMEKSLEERLKLLEKDQLTPADILREGLFGFLPDETLLEDIYPQGEGEDAFSRLSLDPLWKHVNAQLESNQKTNIIRLFNAVRKFAPTLESEDEHLREVSGRRLKRKHLITLGDARSAPLSGWAALSDISDNRANLILEAVKKIY